MNRENQLNEIEFVALDFETTGLKPENSRVIEIGMVKFLGNKIIDTYSSFVNPQKSIPGKISEITGIYDSNLLEAPLFEDIAYEILSFIGNSPIVAHNAKFDLSFLEHELKLAGIERQKFETICTAIISRKIFHDLKKKNLSSVAKHLKIINKNTHRALSDALTTAKIFMKMETILSVDFGIKTLEQLNKFQRLPSNLGKIKFVKKSLLNDLAKFPDSPGVYYYKSNDGKIIYVGKAKSLKKRLRTYFTTYAERKAKKIIRKAKNVEYQKTNSELSALLAETKLIKLHKPEFNTQLKKFPQTWFIKIEKNKEFPYPKISSVLKCDGADYFGPYRNRETATDILDILNKTFLLRECTDAEFKKKKKCYLADLGRCLAPCINPDKEKYDVELARAYDFLLGENQTAVNILLNKMKIYSSRMEFEKAAEIRDGVQNLLKQLKRTSILQEPINRANAVIEIAWQNNKDYILFSNGKFFIKNDITEEKDLFTETLIDYYEGTIFVSEEISNEHIEFFKISLAWLNSHRDLIRIFYLKNYETIEQLFFEINIG